MYSAASGALPPWQSTSTMTKHHEKSAYISVPARHAFVPQSSLPPPPTYHPSPLLAQGSSTQIQQSSSTAAASSATPTKKSKTSWSPSVRDYVNRSFAQESTIKGIAREELESKLRTIITEAAQSGNLEGVNWKEMPLPQQMIQEERKRAALAPPPLSALYTSQMPVPVSSDRFHPAQQDVLRKRKSSELSAEVDQVSTQPPWRVGTAPGSLEDRVSFAPTPDKRQKLDVGKPPSKSNLHLEHRKRRFEDNRGGSYSPQTFHSSGRASPAAADQTGPVVGRSQKLEKNYFRLTSAPNADDVRPLDVLRKSLELLKKKWRTDSNYTYICDQFKSLRQDLTVQHIKNEFTTNVYEIHARIALEKGDLGEYNQCQTQLRALYKQHLGGHPVEFKAYRILYYIYTCNRTDMNDVLSDLTPADKTEAAIKHALDVRAALALGNYHKFFKLYLAVPNMGAYLMHMFIDRERLAAMACICKSYKPDVKLRFVSEELAFEHDEESARFVLQHGGEALLHERDGHVRFLAGKAGSSIEQAKNGAFGSVDIKGQI